MPQSHTLPTEKESKLSWYCFTLPQFIAGGAAAFLLGFGNSWYHQTANLTFFALWLCAFAFVISLVTKPSWLLPSLGQISYLLLVLIFMGVFRYWHNPAPMHTGDSMLQGPNWWNQLTEMCILAAVLAMSAGSHRYLLWIIGAFCAAGSLIGILYCTGSLILGIDRGVMVMNVLDQVIINRAGVMNYLILFPIFWAAYVVFQSKKTTWWEWSILVLSYTIILVLGVMHQSRTIIIALLFAVPLLIVAVEMSTNFHRFLSIGQKIGWWRIGFFIAGIGIALAFLTSQLERPITLDLFLDARFTLYLKSFFEQLFTNPLQNAVVAKECAHPWFHCFFADAHRSSGFGAFLLSIFLTGFIFIRAIIFAKNSTTGRILLCLLLPILLILSTSVVPEGEYQPLLLLLLLGGAIETGMKLESLKYSIGKR